MVDITNARGDTTHLDERFGVEQPPEEESNWAKFDTPEQRRLFCQAYCDWIAQGWADEGFTYKGSPMRTLRNYRKKYPEDFPLELISEAQAKRFHIWESMGFNGAMGVPFEYKAKDGKIKESKNFSAAAWAFNMQNRFKWKAREDVTTNDEKIEGPAVIIKQPEPTP